MVIISDDHNRKKRKYPIEVVHNKHNYWDLPSVPEDLHSVIPAWHGGKRKCKGIIR